MKQAIATLFAAVLILAFAGPAHANDMKLTATPNAGGSSPSVVLNWVQGIVPANSTCPSGSGSTAVTANVILRGSATGGETTLTTITTPGITYTDSAVTPGTTYFYEVEATNCAGTSGPSNEVSVTIPNPLAPAPPTDLTVTTQQ